LTTKKTKKKGKSGKRKTKSTSSSSSSDGVDVAPTATQVTNTKDAIIDGVLRTKDAATALGDAIRSRANELRQDVTLVADTRSYSERAYDTALVSVGLSLGTAGTDVDNTNFDNDGRGGKVDSVMAYYRHGHRNNDSYHHRGNKDRYHDDEEEEIQQQQRPSVL
jgi:hypothetical protein